MGWIDTEDEDVYSEPVRVDPFPFTPEGRRYEAMERELALTRAIANVERLQAEKRELQSALQAARQRRLGPRV
jgi:hypothetical protein